MTSIYTMYGWGSTLPSRIGLVALCMFFAVGCQRTVTERDDVTAPTPALGTNASPKKAPPVLPEQTIPASPEKAAVPLKHQSKPLEHSKPLEQLKNSNLLTTSVQPHPRTGEFNEKQLGKAHTLVVLAFDSVTRQKYFLYDYHSKLTPTQVEQVRDIIDSYESDFARLRDQRAAIFETARDGQGVDVLLKNNRIETVLLSRQVRGKINREVITKERRQKSQAEAKARREAKRQSNHAKK